MIALGLIGSIASIALQGCAHQAVERPAPPVVAIEVKDTPPADLLTCPVAPAGFPKDAQAEIPPAVRVVVIDIAKALASTRDQLVRLVRWHSPGACEDAG
ncbi:hypothetical protein [Sphingobium fuliginis]|nr:hypothetical protein [Sphingobium fuliginis]